MGKGKAVKIIDIDETGESFKLDEKALQKVFGDVPDDLPVSLVSVVGAFRTGKSFLLDFFLRYLKSTSGKRPDLNFEDEPDLSWMSKAGDLLEGNKNKTKGEKSAKGGFAWKHGAERHTTGIWIWDEWFRRVVPSTGKEVAVFIIDTQGMYDSKTGQHLTASIFGLGTLLSSYTVYNLMFQIQEDHLQHLALFSEYGRLAAANSGEDDAGEAIKPFQKLEFLVRDFSKFEDLDEPLPVLRKEMTEYLDKVLSQKFQKDLQEVRDQIELCYQEVSCYCLPHPGTDVSEKKGYDGNIKSIRKEFLRLLGDYIRTVFTKKLAPKKVNGKEVTAQQLFHFVKIYCKLFKEAKIFPEAKTLLQATQEANNLSAIVKAVAEYKRHMDKYIVGAHSQYLTDEKLNKIDREAKEAAMQAFHSVASLGAKSAIDKAEKQLRKEIKEAFAMYRETNRLRDPFAFIAPYIIPITIALCAYVARYILETVCPRRSFTCLDFADFFGSLYLITFTFLLAHMISTGYGVKSRMGGWLSIAGGSN